MRHCTPLRPVTVHATTCGISFVNSVTSVRNLGIYIDADLSGRTHVTKTAAACFAVLRQLRGARRSIPTRAYKSLVVSLVLNRLDYGDATLCGLPDYQCCRLQAVLNAAAKSIFRLQRSDHVTPALTELHWLSAADRVNFKVATRRHWSTAVCTVSHPESVFRIA